MSTFGGDGGRQGGRQEGQAAPSDLIDFYRRWADFRQTAVALSQRPELSSAERQTVNWLILLVDRIGEHDIGPRDRG
jgi:hypothetical protein